MNEIKINKQEKSITIINNGIAFSQFGIAKEILDLVDNQQQEIERLNNIINELEKWLIENKIGDISYSYLHTLNKLQELKENK